MASHVCLKTRHGEMKVECVRVCVSVSLCVWNSRPEGMQGRVAGMGTVRHAVLLAPGTVCSELKRLRRV